MFGFRQAPRAGTAHKSVALAAMPAAQLIGHQNLDPLAEPLFAPAAEQSLGYAIDRRDDAVAIDGNHAARKSLDREPPDYRRKRRVNGYFGKARCRKISGAPLDTSTVHIVCVDSIDPIGGTVRRGDRTDGDRQRRVENERDIRETPEIISLAAALHRAATKPAAALQQFQMATLFRTEN